MLELRNAGYELVIVSNQDGLGTDAYPPQDFEIPQQKMLALFESQGITFSAIHIDPHFEHENAPTRKPGIGMLLGYLQSGDLDMEDSWVIGDRQTDLELAENLGIGGLRIGPDTRTGNPSPIVSSTSPGKQGWNERPMKPISASLLTSMRAAAARSKPVSVFSTICWTS